MIPRLLLAAWLVVGIVVGSALAQEPPPAAESPVRVSAELAKTEARLGEKIALDVRLEAPAGTTWTLPTELGSEDMDVVALPARPEDPPNLRHFEVAPFVLGDAQVPPLKLHYRLADGTEGEATTEAIALQVASTLAKDDAQLIDVRAPLAIGPGRIFWVALALGVLVLVAIGFWIWRRRRRPAPVVVAAPIPVDPAAEARAALDRLLADGLAARGEFRAHYIRLADIVKHYLEYRLAQPIAEWTSSELVAYLRDSAAFGDLATTVRDLVTAADRIKFARAETVAEEARRHVDAARALVGTVETRLAPKVEKVA